MRKLISCCFFGMLLSVQSMAQLAESKSFQFLNVPAHARLAALGGVNVSLTDKDINFLFSNPALVGDTLVGCASAGYTFFIGDIGQSTFSYSHRFKKVGQINFGVQHIGYGEIEGYDATGMAMGTFQSGETALVISKSHQVSNFRFGASVKTVFSNMAGFHSSALLVDLGGTFIHPTKNLQIGLVFKNFGLVLSEYSNTSETSIPFDVQAGVSFKPEHMPLRFSLTAYNLINSAVYDNPQDDQDNVGSFDKLMQHFTFGAEILLHRNVQLLAGYNILKQQELKTQQTGGNGFTMGATIRVKMFELTISRSSYAVGNAAYAFTLSTNINNLIVKKRTI